MHQLPLFPLSDEAKYLVYCIERSKLKRPPKYKGIPYGKELKNKLSKLRESVTAEMIPRLLKEIADNSNQIKSKKNIFDKTTETVLCNEQ